MLIAHLSDTHISAPGQKTCAVAEMDAHLRRCVESLNTMVPRPDVVLLSGDVTHGGTEAETHHAAEILSRLAMPLFIVPGNHDDREILSGIFPAGICPLDDNGFADYVVEGFPVRIIALDSLDAGKAGGRIDALRLDWLQSRLDEDAETPTVLFSHHPPLNLGVPETDEDGYRGAERLGEIIACSSNVERFLCGHVHLHTHTRWSGTVVTTAPSVGMQLALDLTQAGASRFLLSDPAYLLHHWTPDRALVTHHVQLSTMDGPFDF